MRRTAGNIYIQQNIMSLQGTFFVLLIVIGNAYTDITMLNCPAQFDLTAFNQTSDTTATTLGPFIYAAFTTHSNQQRVQDIVVSGDTAELNSYQQQMMIPYIIFAVLYFLLYICLVLSCLFNRSCPPSQCLRRSLEEDPYSKKQYRGVTVVLVICAAGILATTLVGYSLIPSMKEDLEMTNCGIYLTLDTAMNGDENWGGYTALRNKIGNVTNLLSAAVTQIQIYFPGDQWLIDSMKAMRTAALDIYNKYKESQLTTPNPDSTATANNAGQATPLVDSRFIKTGMGPNGTSNTMATDIELGLTTTKKLSDQAYAITKSASLLEASLGTILANSQASQNTFMMYNHQLSVVKTQYDDFSKQYFQDTLKESIIMLQIVYGVALTGSLVLLLGLVSSHSFELLSCRYMVHLGWTIYALIYFGVIYLTYTLLSLGSISYNFCSYFQSMLTVQVDYNKLGESYTQNMFTRLDVCLFGNGNALQKFAIAKEMQTVTNLFTNIEIYYDYTDSSSANYINPGVANSKISGWMNTAAQYKLGVYVDTNPIITSSDNPNYAISQLNLYTYQGGGVATGSKDVWVWDKVNCTDPTYTIYTAGVAPGVTLTSSSVTCISFNEKLMSNSTDIWSFSDFTMRYVQIREAYPDAYKQIQYYGQTLIAFRDSRINLFQAIEDDLSALLTTNTNFNSQLALLDNRVKQFYGAVGTLNKEITDTSTGLNAISNCHSIADKLRFVRNVYCKNFMGQIVKLTLCTIMMLLVMLVGICAGSRMGVMFAQLEKIKRISQPEEAQSEKDIRGVGQLQEEMSNSSRSIDSDD